MSNNAIRKTTTSVSLSSDTLKKIENLKKTGHFSSSSDIVFVAVCEFIGKIKILESNPQFNHNDLFPAGISKDSDKKRMSVAFNIYVNHELDNLSKVAKKPKSYIIEYAVNDFIDSYQNSTESKIINYLDFPSNKQELKDFILQTLKEANDE